ncbi:MAG: adenine phosphoribosyltransferase [Candidatus Dormibacterales bacterium]
MDLAEHIAAVPDFPVKGILFRDITPLLGNARAFREALERMAEPWRGRDVDLVASVEARGFIFGAPLATMLGAGFAPVRKEGHLPRPTHSARYTLEYRSDVLYIHDDAVARGQRVLIVDDLMATGGTAAAAVELVEALGGEVAGLGFLVELADLGGRRLLEGREVRSVLSFQGD